MAEFMADGADPLEFFSAPFDKIPSAQGREKIEALTLRILEDFPELVPYIGWNQPMFTAHGTFIFAFSFAKNHVSLTPEAVGMQKFADRIDELGLSKTDGLFRVPWTDPFPYELIRDMIAFNLKDKADITYFWRHTQEWEGQ